MDTPKSRKLDIIIPAYRMHSQTFLNLLDGISEDDALKRIDDQTNHFIWMAGNFVNMRYSTAWVLGLREEDPHSDLFFQGKAWNPEAKYPTLEELKNYTKLKPTKTFKKGDLRKNTQVKYKFNAFQIEPSPEPDNFENKLKNLLDFLQTDRNGIKKLRRKK